MYRTGDKLSSFAAISSYNTQVNKRFYVGAHSALKLSGFNHYVPMGKPVLMLTHATTNLSASELEEYHGNFVGRVICPLTP